MPRKSVARLPAARLQEYTAIPITDPAEIAELEAKIKAHEKEKRPVTPRELDHASKPLTSAELIALAGQLPRLERVRLVAEIAAQLSADEKAELLERLSSPASG
jgi:hypothetical protein